MTRGVLAGLTRVALLITSFMLREMEFDADRYEARLVGGSNPASAYPVASLIRLVVSPPEDAGSEWA